jgi:hypothetical protein
LCVGRRDATEELRYLQVVVVGQADVGLLGAVFSRDRKRSRAGLPNRRIRT